MFASFDCDITPVEAWLLQPNLSFNRRNYFFYWFRNNFNNRLRYRVRFTSFSWWYLLILGIRSRVLFL